VVTGRRKSIRTLSGYVEDGHLYLFMEGVGNRIWHLPERWDRDGIQAVADEAKAWAIQTGDATHGQTNAIQKYLSEAGYLVRTPRGLS
jgi:hypothetical protein